MEVKLVLNRVKIDKEFYIDKIKLDQAFSTFHLFELNNKHIINHHLIDSDKSNEKSANQLIHSNNNKLWFKYNYLKPVS